MNMYRRHWQDIGGVLAMAITGSLATPRRLAVGRGHDDRIDLRRVRHGEEKILFKRSIEHAPVLHRDLFHERTARPHHDGSLDLAAHLIGIDDLAAVDRRHDPVEPDPTAQLIEGYLDYFGDNCAVEEAAGNTAGTSGRRGRSPSSTLRRCGENGGHALAILIAGEVVEAEL